MLVRMPQDAERHRALPARPLRRGARLLRRSPPAADQHRTPPVTTAAALQAANNLNQILVDDASNRQNPDPIVFGRGGQPLSATNTLRGGDTITGVTGVMTYTWGGASASPNAFRVRPVSALGGQWDFEPVNQRPSAPSAVGGDVRVAAMNLLNYFNTFDGLPDTGPTAVDNCSLGVGGNLTDCRGADTQDEFDRQWPKTVAAIRRSTPTSSASTRSRTTATAPTARSSTSSTGSTPSSAPAPTPTSTSMPETGQTNALGTDAIKVGMLYKPATVTPWARQQRSTPRSSSAVATPRRAAVPRSRRPSRSTRPGRFVADVNHLKSKGSACTVPDAGDGQGNCNASRDRLREGLATGSPTTPPAPGRRTSSSSATSTPTPRRTRSSPSRGRVHQPRRELPRCGRLLLRLRRPVGLPRPRARARPTCRQGPGGRSRGVPHQRRRAVRPGLQPDFKTPEPAVEPLRARTSSGSRTTTPCSSASRRTPRPSWTRRSTTPRWRAVTANASLTVGITDRDAEDTHG